MTKPRLVKVRALFYVFKHITKKRDCVYFDTASLLNSAGSSSNIKSDGNLLIFVFTALFIELDIQKLSYDKNWLTEE